MRAVDETGSLNLFFCFRWLLTSFKRELTFDDTVRLWEVLYTESVPSLLSSTSSSLSKS